MSDLEQAIAGRPGWEMADGDTARYCSPLTGNRTLIGGSGDVAADVVCAEKWADRQ